MTVTISGKFESKMNDRTGIQEAIESIEKMYADSGFDVKIDIIQNGPKRTRLKLFIEGNEILTLTATD